MKGGSIGVLIMFFIPKGCPNAASISDVSEYGKYGPNPDEFEVIMPPYTAFKIEKKDERNKKLYVTVLDNKQITDANSPVVYL